MAGDHNWCDITAFDDKQTVIVCIECGEHRFIQLEIESDETPKTSNQIAGDDTAATKT